MVALAIRIEQVKSILETEPRLSQSNVATRLGISQQAVSRVYRAAGLGCQKSASRKILIGQRYGWLTVKSQASSSPDHHARWLCICGCGSETYVQGRFLINGRIKSCGCKNRLRRLKHRLANKPFTHRETLDLITDKNERLEALGEVE